MYSTWPSAAAASPSHLLALGSVQVLSRSPTRRYKDRLAQATPAWANIGQIYRIYDEAHDMRAVGIPATVDHIYPLAGETVCGLHVHENLQIVTNHANGCKSNRLMKIPPLPPLPSPQGSLF